MLLVAILSFVSFSAAISSGKVSLCTVPPNVYGCEAWKKNPDGTDDRKHCVDDTRIMAWATAPVSKPESFWLYAGAADQELTGEKEYTPGQRMTINLRVREYDMQYGGLIMYAVDAKGNKVGEWDFTGRPQIFHGHCPQTVLHASGELKPYLTSWGFTAPKAGTGKIKFVCLLKTGVANVGDFWFPNDLELAEGAPKASPAGDIRWVRAKAVGKSCTEVCKEECSTLTCNQGQLNAINSPAKMDLLIAPVATCSLPHLARCSNLGATSSEDNMCYYHDKAACDSVGLPFQAPTCDAKSTDPAVGFRICPCSGTCVVATTARPTTRAPTAPPATTTKAAPTVAAPSPAGAPPAPAPGPCDGPNAGSAGCECSGLSCNPGLSCASSDNGKSYCFPPSDKCFPGNMKGCPCSTAADCGTSLENGENQVLVCTSPDASSDQGTCLLEKRFDCDAMLGTAGCWCTEERSCDPGLECSQENHNCVVAQQDTDCAEGKRLCSCVGGTDCDPGLECASFGSSKKCVVAEASSIIGVVADSAADLSVAAAVVVAAVCRHL